MKYIIRQALITDPGSSFNGKKKDIFIDNGVLVKIADHIAEKADQEINIPGMHVSPGWVDMQASFRDPGHEYKEDLASGAAAAARGGFTAVCVQSSTTPAVDNKSQVEFIRRKAGGLPVFIYPIGAVTTGREGKELAEMYDMHQSGAIAFSDDKRFIENPKLMELALEYLKNFGGLLIHYPDTPSLSKNGMMHEGDTSVYTGMKGIPAMAEELGINRDLYLARYTGGKLHYNLLSTAGSVKLLAEHAKHHPAVTGGVAAHQLYFTDQVLEGFESVHKVKPPYRSSRDIEALVEGFKNKVLQTICSDHSPEDVENKNLEYEYASYGIINIQTAFPVAYTVLKDHLTLAEIVEIFAINPRKILGLSPVSIEEGNTAELSFFDPSGNSIFSKETNASKSANSPFFDVELKGKVLGVFCKGNAVMNA